MAELGHRSTEGGRTGLHLNLTHFPVSVRKHLRHTTKLPLTTREMLVVQQYHIIHGKILPHILPLLTNLQGLQILVGPTAPKLVGHVLHLFPSLSKVTVHRTKNAWRVAGQQQMVWSKRLLTLKSMTTGVSGLEFRMYSTSVNSVANDSSVSLCSDNKAKRIFFTDRITLSQMPPMWLARGRLNCQRTPR